MEGGTLAVTVTKRQGWTIEGKLRQRDAAKPRRQATLSLVSRRDPKIVAWHSLLARQRGSARVARRERREKEVVRVCNQSALEIWRNRHGGSSYGHDGQPCLRKLYGIKGKCKSCEELEDSVY